MKNLQLSLKTEWFEMTKSGVKKEDYREINEYWIKRLMNKEFHSPTGDFVLGITVDFLQMNEGVDSDQMKNVFKPFTLNIMTLGYPKADDTSRILKLEHKGIEIMTGNPDWGAVEGKLYFVIKHGEII